MNETPRAVQARLPVKHAKSRGTPDFQRLLSQPIVKLPLPRDFDTSLEADHLAALWNSESSLRKYEFQAFVHAGGSGMVFRVTSPSKPAPVALKIVRHKIYHIPAKPNVATSLSPVSPRELRALERITHPNVVRLYEALQNKRGIYAIATSYVTDPQPLDEYLTATLQRHPDPEGKKGIHPFSPQRLDNACTFLVARVMEMASALAHMHSQNLFHCDIKPANILMAGNRHAMLTDLGACVHPDDFDELGRLRVQFTWTYAHPALTSLVSDPTGISGGGLKASAEVDKTADLRRFDLFAFGRTIQEALAVLAREFGERCYASYSFRFLHLIAGLLLDGRNTSLKERVRLQDGRHFVKDCALEYPVELFQEHAIRSADDLLERLSRFGRQYSWNEKLPELDGWQPDVINTGVGGNAPFTRRVAAILDHPAVRRLRSELQLGWIREVYPGATHTRWSHSIGVFAAAAAYYNALLADPEVPTARVLLDSNDVIHGLLAALLHDVGQTAFGHDLEAGSADLYEHERLIARLLEDAQWGEQTLKATIERHWPDVDVQRVLAILKYSSAENEYAEKLRPADGLAADIVSGPIDADKLDYLMRDSTYCGVAYAAGIDRSRFLQALTVDAKINAQRCRLALAYRGKGAAAVESLLLARYQVYGAVYWHHTFRCIQAEFVRAVCATFASNAATVDLRGKQYPAAWIRDLLYYRVVCGNTVSRCRELIADGAPPEEFFVEVPECFEGERTLEFVWRFADDRHRKLLEMLARRQLFKRVFEVRTGDLQNVTDYATLATALAPAKRLALSDKLEERFLTAIYKKMTQRGPMDSVAEDEARQRHAKLKQADMPLIVIDFPVRGIPEEKNFPREIGDPARKYIAGRAPAAHGRRNIFQVVKQLQTQIASLRVFAAPDLHELIIRYLDPEDVQTVVESSIPEVAIPE